MAIHQPDGEPAVPLVLKNEITLVIAVEIRFSRDLPERIGESAGTERVTTQAARTLHRPDGKSTVGVLPQQFVLRLDIGRGEADEQYE